jgi:hypothetical protein
MNYNLHQIQFELSHQEQKDGWAMWHVWARGEVRTRFWWRPRNRWEDNIKINL